MVREVLTCSVGQCGIQLGHRVWVQYCSEHGVTKTGQNPSTHDDGTFQCFFEETGSGQFVPRNLSVDLEPNVIDDVKKFRTCSNISIRFLISR
jgi:tubulin alpha